MLVGTHITPPSSAHHMLLDDFLRAGVTDLVAEASHNHRKAVRAAAIEAPTGDRATSLKVVQKAGAKPEKATSQGAIAFHPQGLPAPLCVFREINHTNDSQAARLQQNILAAAGVETAGEITFQAPENGINPAEETLASLKTLLTEGGPRIIFTFGEEAARLLTGKNLAAPTLGVDRFGLGITVVPLYSLRAMLLRPAFKKPGWQAILAVKKAGKLGEKA